MKDEPVTTCPECKGKVKRLLYPVGIVFKGSGWHINDYRKPEKPETADSEPAKSESSAKESTASAAKESTGSGDTAEKSAA